jgi:hypothetical protein
MKHIIAVGVAVGLIVIAWQAGGVLKAAIAAGVAQVNAESIHHDPRPDPPRPDPHADPSMPATFVLNLTSGGSFTCHLAAADAYRCTPAPVRNPVKGAR